MVGKSFFNKRTPAEMQKILEMKRVNWQTSLVDKIWNLNENQGLILMSPIIPGQFLGKTGSQAADSRKHYKWGEFLPINQPQSQEEALNCQPHIPLLGRMRAFDELSGVDERDINYLGISWRPVQGNDRRLRLVPFDSTIDAVSLLNYAHTLGTGIEVNFKYATDARIVQREGGQVICNVPSRTKRRQKYCVVLRHVPLIAGKEENAIILSLDTSFIGKEPERETFLHDLRYTYAPGKQTSDRVVFGPHEIAAYFEIIRKEWKKMKKIDFVVPLRMNPFVLPSKEYYNYGQKLDNNLLIYDPTLQSKDKLRNAHLDEKCILLGRAISVKGPWKTAYWDSKRDGPLVRYRGE
jgi:hypothetical protein